ncbi:hypothetical protein [Oceanicoccus sp. KOV_DT_Chl]|uniref:hypothetical protein n=1 Tax=Oceanicoccus sp. KOV_DT_Chl TaxID=1904639 RepID=UPI00190EE2DF|nr:hypothetical protein [Oceanicoccus sp. KOV_DT_Chl]
MNSSQSPLPPALDVSGTVDVTKASDVCAAVISILQKRYPQADFSIIKQIYTDFDTLYRGELAGFLACDTSYHDSQHVLDVSLAMARLIDGYDSSQPAASRLGQS